MVGNNQESGFTIENCVITSVFKFGILNPSQLALHFFFPLLFISSHIYEVLFTFTELLKNLYRLYLTLK